MAITNTELIIESAQRTTIETQQLANAIDALVNLNNWTKAVLEQAGATETFTDYETEIQAVLPHLDGAKLNQFLGIIVPALVTYLESTLVSSGTYNGESYLNMIQIIRTSI